MRSRVRISREVTIVWVKVPTAATAVVCSAGLVAALALPVAMQEAPEVAKDLGVKLSVNWGNLDAFNAIPSLEALLAAGNSDDVVSALDGLDSTNGVRAWVEYLQTGNLEAFRTVDGGQAGLDALNALPLYEDLFSSNPAVQSAALSSLASVSAIPEYQALLGGDTSALSNLDAFSAIPEYQALLCGDTSALSNLDAFSAVPAYAAALSGDPSKLTGLATLDGIPALAGALGGDLTALRPAADGSGGYAALSAIPEYLGLGPSAAAEESDADARVALQSEAPASTGGTKNPVKSFVTEIKSALAGVGKQSAPAVVKNGDKSADIKQAKSTGDGNLGKFTPKVLSGAPILFGSSNSGQEGMRGYGNFLKKLGIGGGDPGDSSAAGDGSGK